MVWDIFPFLGKMSSITFDFLLLSGLVVAWCRISCFGTSQEWQGKVCSFVKGAVPQFKSKWCYCWWWDEILHHLRFDEVCMVPIMYIHVLILYIPVGVGLFCLTTQIIRLKRGLRCTWMTHRCCSWDKLFVGKKCVCAVPCYCNPSLVTAIRNHHGVIYNDDTRWLPWHWCWLHMFNHF